MKATVTGNFKPVSRQGDTVECEIASENMRVSISGMVSKNGRELIWLEADGFSLGYFEYRDGELRFESDDLDLFDSCTIIAKP